jgi:hypothetical protein
MLWGEVLLNMDMCWIARSNLPATALLLLALLYHYLLGQASTSDVERHRLKKHKIHDTSWALGQPSGGRNFHDFPDFDWASGWAPLGYAKVPYQWVSSSPRLNGTWSATHQGHCKELHTLASRWAALTQLALAYYTVYFRIINVVNSISIISYIVINLHWGWAMFGYVWVYLMMSGAKLTLGPIVPLHIKRAKQRPKCPKILARVARCHHDQRSHSATSTGAQPMALDLPWTLPLYWYLQNNHEPTTYARNSRWNCDQPDQTAEVLVCLSIEHSLARKAHSNL